MAKGHRLRRLQMRQARHHRGGMVVRLARQCALIARQHRVDLVDGVAQPQPKIGCDLIVSRARGVQPPRRWPDQLGQAAFDIHVNVLECTFEGELAGLDF